MLEYYKIDVSDNIGTNKTNVDVSVFFCHYWHFLNEIFRFPQKMCDVFHDTTKLFTSVDDTVLITVKTHDYTINFWFIN